MAFKRAVIPGISDLVLLLLRTSYASPALDTTNVPPGQAQRDREDLIARLWRSTFPSSDALGIEILINVAYRVRRERRWSTAGVYPPGNWFAPPGSNQSSSGGNETAEASGAESR
jgi:hypothetical protein